MVMKVLAPRLLARYGFRNVLTVNTLLIGLTIALFSQVTAGTSLWLVVALGAAQGVFNSLQFSSVNSIAYADIEAAKSSMAATMASTLQQMSMSFGLALGTWLTAHYLGGDTQGQQADMRSALHATFLTLGALTLLSSLSFRALRLDDGEAVSRGTQPKP